MKIESRSARRAPVTDLFTTDTENAEEKPKKDSHPQISQITPITTAADKSGIGSSSFVLLTSRLRVLGVLCGKTDSFL